MFFYTSLFIASLLVALVVHWLYRLISDAGRVLSQTSFSTLKSNPAKRTEQSHAKQAQTAGDAVPWGWPGNEHDIHVREQGQLYDLSAGTLLSEQVPDQQKQPPAQRSAHQEKADVRGKAKKSANKETNLRSMSKPWGW